jgi:hypothetical protein
LSCAEPWRRGPKATFSKIDFGNGLGFWNTKQIEPTVAKLHDHPPGLNHPDELLSDVCEAAGIEPLIAPAREGHHPDWQQRFSEPEPLAQGATRSRR